MPTHRKFIPGAALGGFLALGLAMTSWARSPRGEPGPPRPERVEVEGVENAYRLGPRLYSGGQPGGPSSFEALRKLGIKTILSVDGSRPDVEAARRHGLRYVHLPVGYDGIPRAQAVRIVEAARTLPGPVFVHCHHGKHRGPAAAALCGIASEGWGRDQALGWLAEAGTSPDYRGLFASVAGFEVPSAEESARAGPPFPEVAETPALVDRMVAIDASWDRIKEARAAGFRPPAGRPEADPPHLALLLAEHYRELARLPEARARGEGFAREAEAAGRVADELGAALREFGRAPTDRAREEAEGAFRAAGKGCAGCHSKHRDR